MKQALLDTNFILTCVKQKIDFFEWLELNGIKILIPIQVIKEIEKLLKSKRNKNAELALNLLKINKKMFKKIEINKSYVDEGIIKFSKENPKIIIATLDKELKSKIKNKKLVIRNKKKLEII